MNSLVTDVSNPVGVVAIESLYMKVYTILWIILF